MKYLLFAVLCIFLIPSGSQAQIPGSFAEFGVKINLEPSVPKPNEIVTATLDDYSSNIQNASIRWFIDGTEQEDGREKRSITFNSGSLSEQTSIKVVLIPSQGAQQEATVRINPSQIDIIVEPQTYTPSFYQSRGLPSVGSTVSLTAVVTTSAQNNNLSYRWKVGSQVLGGGVQKNSRVNFTVPLGRELIVSVEAIDSNSKIIAKRSMLLPIAEPDLQFYEVNPLKGTLKTAIGKTLILSGSETMVQAVPYHLDRNILEESPLIEWERGGLAVIPPENRLVVPVLAGGNFTRTDKLSFHIRNLNNLIQGVEGNILISN